MTIKRIVGFGEALVDVLPSGEVIGGAPLNFTLRCAELTKPLGWTTLLVSRIGADQRGEKILERLRNSPVDTSAVQVDPQRQTGYVDVTLQEGQPDYTIGKDVAWDAIASDADLAAAVADVDAICFGSLAQREVQSRRTLQQILDANGNAIKVFDINVRKPLPELSVVESSLRATDILKCNSDELLQLEEWLQLECGQQPAAIATELQKQFDLRSVFWTRGAEGCCWQEGEATILGPVPRFDRQADADSVGAGDAASAALVLGVVAKWTPDRIVRTANVCGAFAASRRGPTVPMPDDLIEQLLKSDNPS